MYITVYMKHDDRCSMMIEDGHGDWLLNAHSDYMPYLGVFGGDDTKLRIDNATGQIIGWKPLTRDQIKEWNEEQNARTNR